MPPQVIASDDNLDDILKEKFTSEFRTGYISVDGVCLPEYYAKFAERIENMEVREDDVWVCSFPKTGTTWTQEMVWCIANDLDFQAAETVLSVRFPFLEHSPLFDYRTIAPRLPELALPQQVLDSIGYIDSLPSPRFIKSHLPYNLLPRQIRDGVRRPRIFCVARNPKDTCVSYFHHCQLLEGYRGDFDEFAKLFLAGKLCFAPFWNHVLGYWNKRNEENVLFIKYEDMKTDLPSVVRKTADFLGKHLNDQQVEVLTKHLSFESMKTNPAVNYEQVIELNKKFKLIQTDGQFMRSGTVDQWKGKMSDDVRLQFDKWSAENVKDTEFKF